MSVHQAHHKGPEIGRGDVELRRRYRPSDLGVFDPEERRRFVGARSQDRMLDEAVCWELVYRLEPELYECLIQGEALHREILAWLPARAGRIVEVGAGTGRLTQHLASRCTDLVAVEPAAAFRSILAARLAPFATPGCRVRIVRGFFDALPLPGAWADLVVACSSWGPTEDHGGDTGLGEMERVCAPGGRVVVIWPSDVKWLTSRGYRYRSFSGPMAHAFGSPDEAVRMARIFYPRAVDEVRRRGEASVPYEVLGVRPPRDLVYKDVPFPGGLRCP